MRPRSLTLVLAALALALFPSGAQAFGFLAGSAGFDVSATDKDAQPENQAGAHPHALQLDFGFETQGGFAEGDLRELHLDLPPGFLINPASVEECSQAQFHTPRISPYEESQSGESCPQNTQVGTVAVHTALGTRHFGLFNLVAPFGSPAAFGASPYGNPIVFTARLRDGDAGLSLDLEGLAQGIDIQGLELEIWGTPWLLAHDSERVNCLNEEDPEDFHGVLSVPAGPSNTPPFQAGTCTIGPPKFLEEQAKSYLTLPTTPCGSPLPLFASAASWAGESSVATPAPLSPLTACNKHLTIPELALTTAKAAVGTGLAFELRVNDGGGITNPGGIARPAVKKAIVSLPEGLTINPSVGAGLGVCTQAQFARESASSLPGQGCPNNSKIGEVRVKGMLGLPEELTGSVYVASPHNNPTNSLIALYITAASPRRGLFAASVGKIVPDPSTGRLIATFDNLPRLLYTHFSLTLREGQRALMVSPPSCGTYPAKAELSSWAQPTLFTADTTASFLISKGPDGGPCPSGTPPFAPGLQAGSQSSTAATYTPFYLQMTRTDSEQEITSYSATFPPGLLGKIAAIPYCPEAAIEAAKQRSGIAELNSPSCPAASAVGRTMAGYGVGGVLAYAPGRLYLAGPHKGSPMSILAINSALVGPFDLGVVVVRSAIRVNPRTAQASIDSKGSDPIPHMLAGIPIHLRDIRVHVDRPGFTLNPTSCDVLGTLSTLTGAAANLASPLDDSTATASDRFQASDCQALGFEPRFSIKLKGKRRRGAHPALTAVYRPRPGDANLKEATVTLAPNLFLAQANIDNVCTMVQFRANACPKDSVYGWARGHTPLLDEPVQGPVYLRSSPGTLPDIVADLRGRGFAFEVVGEVDAIKRRIRTTFTSLPDAPITDFTFQLKGGKRGLLELTGRACGAKSAATARFVAHNAMGAQRRAVMVGCGVEGKDGRARR